MANATTVQFIHEGILAGALSFVGWLFMFPLRTAWKVIVEKFKVIDDVHTELTLQRTNCLTTLQSQGEEQIKLLSKMNGTLEAIHLSQSEMSGFLKGSRG